ncbi:hypothetical protein [Herminiimonas sp. KBW02]|uniref:hypothetical protein n=1 Tax=Herminiimonas sp. KBW02 TaxID=2153363 RepID=UPI000F5A06AC|nr:hypothetical protein [Herminiimonas sp. KBW02]
MLSMISTCSRLYASPLPFVRASHIPLSAHTAPVPEPIEDPLPGEHPVPQEDPVPSPNPEVDDPKSPRKAAVTRGHCSHH